ncbi:MAG: hypothetical protein H6744_21320 [Deltaproteobacteria bacterium]|nr:hypothetical protein [Deltaproteobacteria bacterium]
MPRPFPWRAALLASALLALTPAPARAQPTLQCEPRHPGEEEGTTCAILPGDPRGHWEAGRVRPFVSSNIDVGLLYLRPRFSFGYGRPFWLWAGVEVNPILSLEQVGAYGGLRLASSYVDLRVGARYAYAIGHSFLARLDHYEREDVESRAGPHSTYVSLETELSASIPAGPGAILSETALTLITGVDPGYNVFEETIRVVADPPFVWRQRLGYALRVRKKGALSIGVVAEVVGNPARDLFVVRGGVLVRMQLFYNLSLRGTFVPVLWSPDSLGAIGSDTFQIGIRWLWASGD